MVEGLGIGLSSNISEVDQAISIRVFLSERFRVRISTASIL